LKTLQSYLPLCHFWLITLEKGKRRNRGAEVKFLSFQRHFGHLIFQSLLTIFQSCLLLCLFRLITLKKGKRKQYRHRIQISLSFQGYFSHFCEVVFHIVNYVGHFKKNSNFFDKCVIHYFLFDKIWPSTIPRFPFLSIWPFINDNSHKSKCTNPPSSEKSSITLMPKINYVCILGGTNLGKDDEFRSTIYNLGVTLTAWKLYFVYIGGVRGLQRCVVGVAVTRENRVLSFVLKNENTFNLTISIEFKVSTIQQRMSQMLVNSDAFITLPSYILSLQEIMFILFWADKNFHRKPLRFLNVNNFMMVSYLT